MPHGRQTRRRRANMSVFWIKVECRCLPELQSNEGLPVQPAEVVHALLPRWYNRDADLHVGSVVAMKPDRGFISTNAVGVNEYTPDRASLV